MYLVYQESSTHWKFKLQELDADSSRFKIESWKIAYPRITFIICGEIDNLIR